MKVYENVFSIKDKIYIREFDTETKETFFNETKIKIPVFYPSESGEFKAYERFGKNTQLIKKELDFFTFLQEKKLFKESGRQLYGRENLAFEWIYQNYPEPMKCVHDFRTWYFDIEVTGALDSNSKLSEAWKPEFAQQEITLIQAYDTFENKFLVWTLKDYSGNLKDNITLFKCKNEVELLKSFLSKLKEFKPAIIVGWNTFFYDFPYITNRISKVLDKNNNINDKEKVYSGAYVRALSPFGIVEASRDSEKVEYDWKGIVLEDYLNIYKKYTFHTLDSYSLNSVASYELGKEKVAHDEYANFVEFYNNNFDLFFEYGIKDVELLVDLERKLKLLDLCSFISYMTGVCIPDIRGTLKQWNNYVYNEAYKRNIILPIKNNYKKQDVKFIGGMVHSTVTTWDWVASFDFTSLYPSLISWMNLGGDTLYIPKDSETDLIELQSKMINFSSDTSVEEVKDFIINWTNKMFFENSDEMDKIRTTLEKYNLCMSANGTFFTKSKKSLFAELIEKLLIERQKMKKLMKATESEIEELKASGKDYKEKKKLQEYYEVNQIALKVLANSAYGILSMEGCVFAGNNSYFSNAITTSGQVFDILIALTLGELMEKINNSLPENQKVKEKGKDNLKWICGLDTDSAYFSLEPFVKYLELKNNKNLGTQKTIELLDTFIKSKIFPKLREAMDNKISYAFNAMLSEKMNLDREIIADKFFSVGNKCYFTRIFDSEGVKLTEPKLKIVGLAVKKSNTPLFFRKRVLEAMKLLLDKDYDKINALEKKHKDEIYSAHPDELSSNVNVNSIDYDFENGKLYSYEKGKKLPAPIHSRGAIFHNLYIKKNNLNIKLIENGNKCKMITLKKPNPIGNTEVLTYIDPNIFDEELKKYIDYDALFEKFYIGVLNLIRNPLNLFKDDFDDW